MEKYSNIQGLIDMLMNLIRDDAQITSIILFFTFVIFFKYTHSFKKIGFYHSKTDKFVFRCCKRKSDFHMIEQYFLRGKTITEIEEQLKKVSWDFALSHGMIIDFVVIVIVKAQMMPSTQDIQNEINRGKGQYCVEYKICEIAKMVTISDEQVFNILQRIFVM